ncbi:metabolite transporter (DMT) superfamily [Vibrio ponticus]|nr:metabolite transporter (DMT) superfamily [Vibrio ponticus]
MQLRDLLLAVLVMVIWGFNFSMIKLGVSEVNPLVATAARFALAAIPLVLFISKPDTKWLYVVSYGVVFGVGAWGMASWSIVAGLSSGMSSVLLTTNVILGMLVGVVVLKESLTRRKLLGGLLATIAVVLSIANTNGNVTVLGVILILIAAVSWVVMGVILKASKTQQPFAFSVWGMLVAPLPLITLAVIVHGSEVISNSWYHWSWNTSAAVMFQAYPTTLFGYWVWNKLLLKYPLSVVSPLNLLVPLSALLSGYLIYDENLSASQLISCGLYLVGIALIVIAPKKTKAQSFDGEMAKQN